jgi:hypothetical protein
VPDPVHPSLAAYELREGRYVEIAHVKDDEIFRTDRPYPFEVSPRQLVTDDEWRPARD